MNSIKLMKEKELNDRGLILLQEGKPEQAIKCFEEAIECDGKMLVKSWSNKGLALKEMTRLDEAIECFDKALALEKELKEDKFNSSDGGDINSENEILKHLSLDQNSIGENIDDHEELCRRLEETNEFDPERIKIIEALGSIRDSRSIPYLLKALETDYAIGRDVICNILCEMFCIEAVPIFHRLLSEDQDLKVRAACARALGKISAENSMEILIKALNDISEEVKDEAYLALHKYEKNRDVAEILNKHKKEKIFLHRIKDEEYIEKVIYEFDNNEVAEKILIEALKDDDREDFNIIRALSFLKSENAIEPLIRILKDKNISPVVRSIAAKALGNMEVKKGTDHLIKALKDSEFTVKCSAVEALGNLKEKRAVEPLINMTEKAELPLIEKIIEALVKIRALQPLHKALGDKRDHIRSSAIEALSKIKGEQPVNDLKKIIKKEDRLIKNGALKALLKMEAFDELIKTIKDPKCCSKCVELLISSDNEEIINSLIKALTDPDDIIREKSIEILGMKKIKEAVKPLKEILYKDPSRNVKKQAIEALGKFGSFDILIKFMEENKEFEERVIEVIGLYGDINNSEYLIKFIKNENPKTRAQSVIGLGRINPPGASEYIIQSLKDRDGGVRANACLALGNIKSENIIKHLCSMLKDSEPEVRKNVKISLENICLDKNLRNIVIANLNKFSSFSITSLFNKEQKTAQMEAKELLKTIQILNP